ncbi:M15 family metallopeptidase [Streptomyces otsuchiensis]|uniref:M15 family metallopeptidase n=1 Tax=Streptomyces otsuchiensis TaxID=2681388 RepID=UPI00102F3B10|nr:M15 family metallopeptidase [Streptomyces otsuchiensis]
MTTLIADPRVTGISVRECAEPLVTLDWIAGPAAGPARMVREGLAGRLALARQLLPEGLLLHLSEGYRPVAAQRAIVNSYAARLRAAHPGLDGADLDRLTSRYVAPVEVAPHVAGAAVDITLADRFGRPLWMGCELDATPEESDGACYFDAEAIGEEARANRRLLGRVLTAAGLVNYPTEWWHWSYGDRYWAHVTGAAAAVYGPVAPSLVAA